MYYTEKLSWLRDCRNVTQKEISAYLGIKQQQYARYEKGINIMPVTYLPKICEFYNVSADYILGFTEEEKPLPKTKIIVREYRKKEMDLPVRTERLERSKYKFDI